MVHVQCVEYCFPCTHLITYPQRFLFYALRLYVYVYTAVPKLG